MDIQLIGAIALVFNTLNVNLEGLLHYIPNVQASNASENQYIAPSPNMNREDAPSKLLEQQAQPPRVDARALPPGT